MSASRTASTLDDQIRLAYFANVPILLEGPTGVGKSLAFDRVCRSMDIKLIVLDLSLIEPTDLIGLPFREGDATVYAPPRLLPRNERGILLLEELSRAPLVTRNPALELLTRRRLHEYVLPDGWLPCAAMNPAGDVYSVDALDPALRARFLVVKVEADHAGWLVWAEANGIHPGVLTYVRQTPDIFTTAGVCPRSLEFASRLAWAAQDPGYLAGGDGCLLKSWSDLLGPVGVTMYRVFKREVRVLTPKEILESYNTVRSEMIQLRDGGRLDVLGNTFLQLQRELERQAEWDAVQRDMARRKNLQAFIDDLPGDMQESFEAWLLARNYKKRTRR